jgi:hypothetical protein
MGFPLEQGQPKKELLEFLLNVFAACATPMEKEVL